MYKVLIEDHKKKIARLSWEGEVDEGEVRRATAELEAIYKEFGNKKFYLIVDLQHLKVFAPSTKDAIVEQQRYVVPMLHEVADVIPKMLTKKQIDETKEKAENSIAKTFPTIQEALKYLQERSIY